MRELYLTFDVEPFWVNIPEYRTRDSWVSDPCTQSAYWSFKFVEYCERFNIPATIFVVGRWAEDNKEFIQYISNNDLFEIGSHSYWHENLSEKTDSEFVADVSLSKKVLEDIVGDEVIRFRAPSFSIKSEQFKLLSELGFKIDSSITQSARIYGGGLDCRSIEENLMLYPFEGMKLFQKQITLLGGGYLRVVPELLLKKIRFHDIGNMIYLHPCDMPDSIEGFKDFRFKDNLRKTLRFGNMFRKLDLLRTQCVLKNF